MTENNLQQIYEELKQLKEENIKFRRLYEDTIYNLDEDNFPGFSKVIRAVNETYENVAQIQGQVNNQGATISQIVTSEIIDGETVYEANASFIISAINGQSAAKINADLIQMTGTVVFLTQSDVGASGTATIHGDRVRLGSILSNNYSESAGEVVSGMKINLNNGTIISKNFKLDEDGNVEITGIINATAGVIGGSLISMPWYIGTDTTTGVSFLWNGKHAFMADNYEGVYIGTNGIACGSNSGNGVVKITRAGVFSAPVVFVDHGHIHLTHPDYPAVSNISFTSSGNLDIYNPANGITITTLNSGIGIIAYSGNVLLSASDQVNLSGDTINLIAPNGVYINGVRVY